MDYDRLLPRYNVVWAAEASRRRAVDAYDEPSPLARNLDVVYRDPMLGEPSRLRRHLLCSVYTHQFDVGLQR